MDKAVSENLLERFAVNNYNRPDLKISHLLFADDTDFLWSWSGLAVTLERGINVLWSGV
jgi:hypothetical protein